MLSEKELQNQSLLMIKNPTYHEVLFKNKLTLHNTKYLTQVVIGFYIADFVFPERVLIVELDGTQHKTTEGLAHDKSRDNFLKSLGFNIVRIDNVHVKEFDLSSLLCLPILDSAIYQKALNFSKEVFNKIYKFDQQKVKELTRTPQPRLQKTKTHKKKSKSALIPKLVKKGTVQEAKQNIPYKEAVFRDIPGGRNHPRDYKRYLERKALAVKLSKEEQSFLNKKRRKPNINYKRKKTKRLAKKTS